MKTGLVMEGGAMRGMYTAGVVDILLENDVEVDGCMGVSAGATFGCNYKSRQIGRAIRYNKRFAGDWRYCSIRSFLTTGDLYGTEFCYHVLPYELDVFDVDTFSKNPVEFWLAATDVHTGKPRYHRIDNGDPHDLEWMRASASMPVVSHVVSVDGFDMLDGGISDSIPLKAFEDMGYEKNLVILTQPADYRKEPQAGIVGAFMNLGLRKYPAIAEDMRNRHLMYNDQLDYVAEREASGAALVLRPSRHVKMSRTESNPDVLEEMYQLGRSDAIARLQEIKNFLAK